MRPSSLVIERLTCGWSSLPEHPVRANASQENAAGRASRLAFGDSSFYPRRVEGTLTEGAMSMLPSGTVTFLFADVEGSTELLQRLGQAYAGELKAHRAIVRGAVERAGGEVVDQRGEEAFAAFGRASDAVAGALEIQQAHEGREMKVRIGLHTGEPSLSDEGYLGLDVHRAARICAAGCGGQVLMSAATRTLVPSVAARDLGEYALKGIAAPELIFVVDAPGVTRIAQPLRATPAEAKRRGLRAGRPASQARTGLRELAWEIRARLPVTPEVERPSVSALAAAMFAAAHAESDAAAYLARTDRRVLEQRVVSYRDMSVTSRRSARELDKVERQLACLDALSSHREELERAARGQPASRTDITAATQLLEETLEEARALVGHDAEPLRKTLSRGVYRSPSGEYVVLEYDTVGIERRHRFATRAEARARARTIRFQEKQERLSDPLRMQVDDWGGGGGG